MSNSKIVTSKAVSEAPSSASLGASQMVNGTLTFGAITDAYQKSSIDLSDLIDTARDMTRAVSKGDYKDVEAMLVHQALALQSMFAGLAVRASNQTSAEAAQALMRMALRAQTNSRATLQTLVNLKAPKQVAFVKQANLAQNQQINNGRPSPTLEEKNLETLNELLAVRADGTTQLDC